MVNKIILSLLHTLEIHPPKEINLLLILCRHFVKHIVRIYIAIIRKYEHESCRVKNVFILQGRVACTLHIPDLITI